MFNVTISTLTWQEAKTLVLNSSIGSGLSRQGLTWQKTIGIASEIAICDLLDYPHPKCGKYDQGIDYKNPNGATFDVKSMGRNTSDLKPHYANNYFLDQFPHAANYFIFCSFNKNTFVLTICGYLSKKQLFERGSIIQKGEKRIRDNNTYTIFDKGKGLEIRMDRLKQFTDKYYFKEEIERLPGIGVKIK